MYVVVVVVDLEIGVAPAIFGASTRSAGRSDVTVVVFAGRMALEAENVPVGCACVIEVPVA